MISILTTFENLNIKIHENSQIINEFIDALEREYGFIATIGVGSLHENIFENVKESYINAAKAFSFKFFHENEKLIFYQNIVLKNVSSVVTKFKEEKSLTEAIIAFDTVQAEKVLDEIFNRMISPEYPDVIYFKETSIRVILDQAKILNNIMQENEYKILETDIVNRLNVCDSFSEFKAASLRIINELVNILNGRKITQNEHIMKKCIKYIEGHYMEDLSLDTLSQMFHFNSSYFSNYFKNCMGVCYSEFLLKIRLDKACDLLKSSNMKVYEIAIKVGYNDPKYFNRIFKKKYGVSPDEYRRINSYRL